MFPVTPVSTRRAFVGQPMPPGIRPALPRIVQALRQAYDTPPVYGAQILLPFGVPRGNRLATFRGLYRVFAAAAYRFYRSTGSPPVPGSAPFATSTSLPNQPAVAFANGTWFLAMSYFNGVLDSGFLPIGARGETYLTLEIAGGAVVATRPGPPISARLEQLAGGIVQIVANYSRGTDGINAATEWSIAYTTNGTTPPNDSPTATKAMSSGPLAVLTYKLPAVANGTTIKVQLQTRRGGAGGVYSLPGAVLSIVVNTTGPTAPLSIVTWPGSLPEDL